MPYKVQQLFIVAACICISSCLQTQSSKVKDAIPVSGIKLPTIMQAGKPFVVEIDTCIPANNIHVSAKDSFLTSIHTAEGIKKITITPPAKKPADFFVTMQVYNMEKGLAIDAVLSSYEDKTGNLWFGTLGGGVTRYDGKSSLTITADEGLGNNAVTDITEDAEGNIWFALDGGGLTKYDGRSLVSYGKPEGLLGAEVYSITLDKNNNVLLATRKGLSRFDGKSFYNFETPESLAGKEALTSILDNNGNLWFGTRGDGINRFDGLSFTHFTTAQGLINNKVHSSYLDYKGNLWFGTTGGISMYDGKSFLNFSNMPGLPKYNIHSIKEDKGGKLWFGSFGGGVSRFDGNYFLNFTMKQGLAGNIVQTITKDKNENLWFGTEDGGVSCFNGEAFISYSTTQGLADNIIRSVIQDSKGKFWFGTNSQGVSNFDGKHFTSFSKSQGLNHNRVHRILEDRKNNLWFCTNGGVSRYDGKSIMTLTTDQGLAYNHVRCIIEDKKGNLWFGTEMGLSKYDGKMFSNFTTAQGLPSNNIRDMIEDEAGNLWLGTHEAGLIYYNGKSFLNFNTNQGLVHDYIFNLTKDSRGNIWICTGNGGISILRKDIIERLINYHEFKPGEIIFESFTTNEGLADNVVYDLVEDKKGNIIIGTNLGFTVIKDGLHARKPIRKENIEYYNWKNGYPVKDINTQSMYIDNQGIIWAGTGDKLIRFDYSAIHKNPDPPVLRIQKLQVNNENISWYNLLAKKYIQKDDNAGSILKTNLQSAIRLEEKILYGKVLNDLQRDSVQNKFGDLKFDSVTRFYPLPVNLNLPFKNNNLSFEFAAIEPARPYLVRYQYMLEGYDKDWAPITNNSRAHFGNINEGNYTFKVKAMSPDGVWSFPVLYSFKVLPPWYRSWWAYSLYVITASFLIYSIYKKKIRQMEKKQAKQLHTIIATQEEERKRISRDLHDDVGTKLSALKLFLSSLKNSVEKKQYQQADQLADNSENLINQTIKDVRNMLLNLSPGILEEFGFTTAIESLVNKINQTNTIHFDLSVFGMNENLKIEYQLALYRITQELINNVLKHSNAKRVSLQIGYRDEKIIIMIEDDGKGFDLNQHKDGYGLKNLEARTKLLNGAMNIDSQPGRGTSISIEVPYKFIVL